MLVTPILVEVEYEKQTAFLKDYHLIFLIKMGYLVLLGYVHILAHHEIESNLEMDHGFVEILDNKMYIEQLEFESGVIA